MQSENHKKLYNAVGIFLLIWGVLAIGNALYMKEFGLILWQCYIGLIVIGFGIIKRNSSLIGSQLNIIAIPLILWTIDFLYYLITSNSLWGISDYFFVENRTLLSNLITLQHVFTIPLALFVVYNLRFERKDFWKISMIQLVIIYFLSYLLTSREDNINCVFEPCLNINFQFPYAITWFSLSFLMVFLTNYLLVYLFKR